MNKRSPEEPVLPELYNVSDETLRKAGKKVLRSEPKRPAAPRQRSAPEVDTSIEVINFKSTPSGRAALKAAQGDVRRIEPNNDGTFTIHNSPYWRKKR